MKVEEGWEFKSIKENERKGKERKGKERKGKERKGKERKGKERKEKGILEKEIEGNKTEYRIREDKIASSKTEPVGFLLDLSVSPMTVPLITHSILMLSLSASPYLI